MAELTSKDRLQPALLDRLTDFEPSENSESRERRVVSMCQLRQGVLRDLSHLLNATGLSRDGDGRIYPFVEHSVLNYGLPNLAGKTLASLDMSDVGDAIAQTIRDFEPRIISRSLRVTPLEPHDRINVLAFLIEGDLWAQPYPERLYFKTEFDLEDGQVSVSAQAG
jgi:type VI secretion system protein ImpF